MILRSSVISGCIRFARVALAFCLCWGLTWSSGKRVDAADQTVGAVGQRLIVRLRQESVARAIASVRGLDTASAQRQIEAIESEQREAISAIQQQLPGATVEYAYRVTFNGLAVRLPAGRDDAVNELRALPQVRAVYEEAVFMPSLYASVPYIGAETLWANLGGASFAGAGIRIAILDSGVNIAHPMFNDTGYTYPSGYPKGDTRYTSRKVIAARTYIRPYDPPIANEHTPLPGSNGSGHGTHMAGIAAGNVITATYRGISQPISGVAPRAYLMNYRIFYPTAADKPEVAYTAEILRAIEDAVNDGAQVLCNAWSSATPRPPLASPEAEALEAAIEAGCVVVAPAGNDGPGYGSASRTPGGVERVITVGASTKDRFISWDFVDVTGPTPVDAALKNQSFARAEFGSNIATLFGPYPYTDVSDVDPNDSATACNTLPTGALANKIALIARGDCYFADKAYVAQQAGARLALIYNDTDEITEMGCAGDHCEAGEITIPAALVSRSYGLRLLDWLDEHPGATVQLDPNARVVASPPDVLATSSGRGPAYARYLKPDLVAPGDAVLSAYHASGASEPPYEQISGTSVACAHVAGAAALLLQAHPTWTHDKIKSALMATADRDVYATSSSGTPTSLLGRGAGRVDLTRASNPSVLCSPASVSLGQVSTGTSHTVQIALNDPCTRCGSHTYTLALAGGYGLTMAAPAQITVNAGGAATLNLTLNVRSDAPAGDIEAELTLTSGSTVIYVPIWAYVTPRLQSAQVLLLDNDSSAFDSYADYSSYITKALTAKGISYVVWDADARFGNSQTVPNLAFLQQYKAVIWLTGDNTHPDGYYTVSTPLTAVDQQILASYLDAGGRLLAVGQNLAQVSDVNPVDDPVWGRAMLYHNYLGAHWLQNCVFDSSGAGAYPPQGGAGAVGLPGTFLADVELHLGQVGDGAGNQKSIDEIAPGGLADGSDVALAQPLMRAVEAEPEGDGIIALAKAEEPTLDDETISLPYRTLYYSFGIEGINTFTGMTTRDDFVGRSVDWLLDDLTVTLPEVIGSANELTTITCEPDSSRGAEMRSFLWRIGEGDNAQSFTTDSATITYLFTERGHSYPVAVEVTDALGHKAIARSTVSIVEGGGSTLTTDRTSAIPGDTITYQAVVYNSGVAATNASLSLSLPSGTEYVSHLGGSYTNGTLTWSGSLPADASFTAELKARVGADLALGTLITATARFAVGSDTFTRTVSTRVLTRSFLPVILR